MSRDGSLLNARCFKQFHRFHQLLHWQVTMHAHFDADAGVALGELF